MLYILLKVYPLRYLEGVVPNVLTRDNVMKAHTVHESVMVILIQDIALMANYQTQTGVVALNHIGISCSKNNRYATLLYNLCQGFTNSFKRENLVREQHHIPFVI